MSAPSTDFSGAIYQHGRTFSANGSSTHAEIVDAVTGELVSRVPYMCLAVDTSGALAWRTESVGLWTSSGPASDGLPLPGITFASGDWDEVETCHLFTFGVLIIIEGQGELRVLRFDRDVEHRDEASAVAVCDGTNE